MVERIFSDMYDSNKVFLYYVDVVTTIDNVEDIEEIKDILYAFRVRFMNIPDFGDDQVEVEFRIDLEDENEVSSLADVLYDNDFIDDEEYKDFEEMVEEYE